MIGDFFSVRAIKVHLQINYEQTDSICTVRGKGDEYRTGRERIDGKGALSCIIVEIILDEMVANLVEI